MAGMYIGTEVPRELLARIEDYQYRERRTRAAAMRVLLATGLEHAKPFETGLDHAKPYRPEEPEQAPLLLPPPAEKPAPSLTELADLIRKTAETNPFVRPLADMLEGKM